MPPRKPVSWDSAVSSFTSYLKRTKQYSNRTVRFYKEQAEIIGKKLKGLYGEITPKDIEIEHIQGVLDLMRKDGLAISSQKNYIIALKRICEYYDNFVFTKYKIIWPQDTRPNVNWLSPEQARTILSSDLTPLERIIVTLELQMGLRRIEVLRLKVSDVKDGYINVTGKGRAGGKLRLVPFHPNFESAYRQWMNVRTELVTSIKSPLYVDECLIGYKKGRNFLPFSDVKGTGIDRHIKEVSKKTGIPLSHHTLRRTFGRVMWLSGVSVVTIAKLLGHKSTEQTLLYIGANMDDMAQAMAVFQI